MKDILREGEKLLYHHKRVGLAVYKSAPTIHAAGSVPGLHHIELLVTDRRVIIRGAILGGVPLTEFDLWYAQQAPSADCDVLERVSTGASRPGGKYLHLFARAREHGPLRSDTVEMYLYTDEVELLLDTLNLVLAAEPMEWR
ncbi:MAG TPA: hypothetical protein VJG32_10750 [Anaerolineae bacterium]|nr:hypothetical protein [Anaerolineae bacterium]